MIGIYLLFFTSFLFLGEAICVYLDSFKNCANRQNCINHAKRTSHKATKYIFAKYGFVATATIFCALPIFFALWDFYSLAHLFYSLFGGVSVFSALLMARFVTRCVMRDFGESFGIFTRFTQSFQSARFQSIRLQGIFLLNPINLRAFLVIFIFSLALFLGHLDLIPLDIFNAHKATTALFIGVFIIALYIADKSVGFIALFAFIISLIFMSDLFGTSTQSAFFALFDGYGLIYSFMVCAILALKSFAQNTRRFAQKCANLKESKSR